MSDHGALLDYLTAARWFGGKGREPRLERLVALPWLRDPGDWPAVRVEIAEVGYPDTDDHELYQLLISYAPDVGDEARVITELELEPYGRLPGTDGTDDPAARDALLAGVVGSRAVGTTESPPAMIFHQEELGDVRAGLPSRVFGGEQSNTSIMYAHVAMLKLFRRLEIGYSLDIEIHRVLTRTQSTGAARLYGWAEGVWDDPTDTPQRADLAMVVEQLPDTRDGWEFALAHARTGQSFDEPARQLGRALAAIHRTLAAEFPVATVDGDEVADLMTERYVRARRIVPALRAYADGLERTFDALRGQRLPVQRLHGDFHLGQALHTAGGWKIIDFEGEPLKTLAERRRPDHPLRDVGGALRSFGYATAYHVDTSGPAGQAWLAGCRRSFLTGYADVAGALGAAMPVLRAYEADKAIYEAVYEARNRPDWLPIPLAAIGLLARTPRDHRTADPPSTGDDDATGTAGPRRERG